MTAVECLQRVPEVHTMGLVEYGEGDQMPSVRPLPWSLFVASMHVFGEAVVIDSVNEVNTACGGESLGRGLSKQVDSLTPVHLMYGTALYREGWQTRMQADDEAIKRAERLVLFTADPRAQGMREFVMSECFATNHGPFASVGAVPVETLHGTREAELFSRLVAPEVA